MRLTLRTLLAYLDDVLPPDQAKELGQKLSESGFATALVDRIKEVMRRRRLSAPELFSKAGGVEPNLVAEYLDNELSPNEVADVEKICLDSDVHLAEVAACHQILTLVLGEPVDVRPETRSRMYALGPVAPSEKLSPKVPASTLTFGSDYRSIPSVGTTHTLPNSEFDQTLPDYLRPKTSWKRVGLLALVVLVAVGWIGLLMRDPTVVSGLKPGRSSDDSQPPAVDATKLDEGVAKTSPAPDQLLAKTDGKSVAPSSENAVSNNIEIERPAPKKSLPAEPIEPVGENVAKADTDKLPAKPATTSKEVAALEKPELPEPPQPKKSDTVPDNDNPPQNEPAPLLPRKLVSVSKEGVLLHFDEAAGDFMVLPRRAELKAGDRLACPEPFRSDVMVGNDECLVALVGGTAVTVLPPTDKASFGFEVVQGSLLLESKGPPLDADADAPAKGRNLAVTISLRGQRHLLELLSDDAVCGLEIRRREPTRFETEPDEPGYSGALYVARGAVRFTFSEGKSSTVEGPGFLALTADASANLKASEIGRAAQLVLPDWLEPDPKRAAAKQKRLYNAPFEKEFDPEQPLLLSLPAVVSNPRPALSELAVKCLALTDSYQALVKALVSADHREARLAAISGLRQWLPQDARNRQLLKAELARHFLPTDSEAVYRLLWGFRVEDAKTPAISRQLVGWLEHEHVAVRELAFWHIQQLTGLKNEYSPINPPGQRRVAIERWHSYLEKKGGVLISE